MILKLSTGYESYWVLRLPRLMCRILDWRERRMTEAKATEEQRELAIVEAQQRANDEYAARRYQPQNSPESAR